MMSRLLSALSSLSGLSRPVPKRLLFPGLAALALLALCVPSGFAVTADNPKVATLEILPDTVYGEIKAPDKEVKLSAYVLATPTPESTGNPSVTGASWSFTVGKQLEANGAGTTWIVTRDELTKWKDLGKPDPANPLKTIYTFDAGVRATNVSLDGDFTSTGDPVAVKVIISVECPCACTTTAGCHNDSVNFSVAMGRGDFGGASQSLTLRLDTINFQAYRRASITWNGAAGTGEAHSDTVLDLVGGLRQLVHGRDLADVQDLAAGQGYTIKIYPGYTLAVKGGVTDPLETARYRGIGEPYYECTVFNPDAAPNGKLKISQVDRRTGAPVVDEWLYSTFVENAKEYWILTAWHEGRLASRDTLERTEIPGGMFSSHSQIRTIEKAGSDDPALVVTSRTKETYGWLLSSGKTLLELVEGFGEPGARTTTWEYYTDPGQPVTFGLLKSTRTSSGSWSQFEYEAGTGTSVRRQFQGYENAPFGDRAHARVTTNTRSTIRDASGTRETVRTEVSVLGTLVSRTQSTSRQLPDGTSEETDSDALPDQNKKLTRLLYNSAAAGPGQLKLRFTQYPDGTVERHSYAVNAAVAGAWTEATERGAGNESAVTDGTRTTRGFNARGVLISESVADIVTGLTISQKQADPTRIDSMGRVLRWIYDGDETDFSEISVGCCGNDSERLRDGTFQQYTYDDNKRLIRTSTTLGSRTEVTAAVYSGLTRQDLRQINGILRVVAESTSDLAGRVTTRRAVAGNATNFELVDTVTTREDLPAGGERVTTNNPDGSTDISESLADGKMSRSVQRQGWATQLETVYSRGMHSERGGGLWEEQRQNGVRWSKAYTGLNGVQLKQERPTFAKAGVAATTFEIDSAGRVIKVTPPLGAATLTTFNTKGEVSQTILDVDGSGTLTAPDRVSRSTRESVASVAFGGQTFSAGTLQSSSVINDAGTEIVLSRQWSSFDGLASASESLGLVTSFTRTKPLDGASTVTSTAADGTSQVQISANGLPVESLSYIAGSSVPLHHSITFYDNRWRRSTETERRHVGGAVVDVVTRFTYFDSDQLKSVRTAYDIANSSAGTIYTRDILGREIATQLPDGSIKSTVYTDSTGTVRVSGSQTYPNETRSDAFGQMAELKTWQNFTGNTGLATTSWVYDPATGLLLEKQYADGKKVQYQYDAAGRLAKRTWARGIETTYAYTPAGSLDSVTYSDATPAVTYSYDRNGQMVSAGGYSYTYDPATLLPTSETISLHGAASEEARVITRKRDALLRETGLLLSGSTPELESTWGYDNAGRPKTVTAQGRAFTYDYVDGRPELLATVPGLVHTVVNTWEPLRGVLVSTANQRTGPAAATVSAYEYAVNSLGQRKSVRSTGEAFAGAATADWDWSYNPQGELISAASPTDQTRNKAFLYDDIGNRAWATAGAHPLALDNPQTEPTGGSITRYTANALNQYTSIDPGTPVAPAYDDDGNMLDDGTLLYVWDGENRLASVKRKADGSPLAAYTYDYQSRRMTKATTAAAPQGAATTAFLYDGWNIIAEYNIAGGHATLNATNVWGPDLSGSQQGAGGVGGLLTRASGGIVLNYAYDANGNVTELVDGTGAIAAHYEYDPFGKALTASGFLVDSNPFRFSTKLQDEETGLLYYGYRYYQVGNGRWLSRDPLEEDGGLNSYAFVDNDCINKVDLHGMKALVVSSDHKGAGLTDKTAQMFSANFAQIDEWVKQLESVSEDMFKLAQKANKVKFNKEDFTGTRDEFISRMKREKDTKWFEGSVAYKDALSKLKEFATLADRDWDVVGFAAHSSYFEGQERPSGMVNFSGGTEEVDAGTVLKDVRARGATIKGKFLYVSCFRTWKKGMSLKSAEESLVPKAAWGAVSRRIMTYKDGTTKIVGCNEVQFNTIGLRRMIGLGEDGRWSLGEGSYEEFTH